MPGKLLDMLGLKRRPKPPPAASAPLPPAAPPPPPKIDFRREVNAYRLGLRSDADPLVRSERFAQLIPAWQRITEPAATPEFSATLAALQAALEPASSLLSTQLAECESRARDGEWELAYAALQKAQAAAVEIAQQEPAFVAALRAYFAAAPALPATEETALAAAARTTPPASAAKRLSEFPELLASLEVESELTIVRDCRRKLRSLHEELTSAGDEVAPGPNHRRLIQSLALAEQIRSLQRLEAAFKPRLIAAEGWRAAVARLRPTHREQLLEQRRLGQRLEASLQHACAGRFAESANELPQCLAAADTLLQKVAGPLAARLVRLQIACQLPTPLAPEGAAPIQAAVETASRWAREGDLDSAVQTLVELLPAGAAEAEASPAQPAPVQVDVAEGWSEDLAGLLYDLGWNLDLGDPRQPEGSEAWERWLRANIDQAIARAASGEANRQLQSRTEHLRKLARRLCPSAGETPDLQGLSQREAWEKIASWSAASAAELDRGNRAALFTDEASAGYLPHALAVWSRADQQALASESARCGGAEGLSPREQSQALQILRVHQTDGD